MGDLNSFGVSRRAFLGFGLFSLPGFALAGELFRRELPMEVFGAASGGYVPPEALHDYTECFGCDGRCRILCPACDGSGIWTTESESTSLYQRELARRGEYCAWCEGTGEVDCPTCSGVGWTRVIPAERKIESRTH